MGPPSRKELLSVFDVVQDGPRFVAPKDSIAPVAMMLLNVWSATWEVQTSAARVAHMSPTRKPNLSLGSDLLQYVTRVLQVERVLMVFSVPRPHMRTAIWAAL